MTAKYKLTIAHLYGDLMNTYGDYGNILVLKYYGRKMGVDVTAKVVSLDDSFRADDYDLAIFGDGQYFEQSIVAQDLPKKATELRRFTKQNAPMLAVGEGFQLLGKYYVTVKGQKQAGLGLMAHRTLQKHGGRDFVGEREIVNPLNHHHYHGFEHHQDQTFLGANEQPLGKVIRGEHGNNERDATEGAQFHHVYCTYLHSFLARNPRFAKTMLLEALRNKYPHANLKAQQALSIAPSY